MTYADDQFNSAAAQLYEKRLKKTNAGTVQDTPANVVMYLEGEDCFRGLLAMDQFLHRICKLKAPPWDSPGVDWTETDMALLRVYLSERHGALFSLMNIEHAVLRVANNRSYHPVRDYLDALEWDGEARIQYWLGAYLDATRGADEALRDYLYTVGPMWLIAAVARIYEPGCKFDNVLILEGEQGVGKSTALAILGGEWFSDTPFRIGEKDGFQSLQGNWIVELAELENFSGVDSSRAKAFFSSAEDDYRPSYGRRNQKFARQCVFAGTTNQREYLKDSTGNRRYWPVHVHKLDRDALARDRGQLWAEACTAYRGGLPYFLRPDDPRWQSFKLEQELREVGDPWETAIGNWLANRDSFLKARFTLFDVLERALMVDVNRMDRRAMSTRVGIILNRLGWDKRRDSTRAGRASGGYFYVERVRPAENPDRGRTQKDE